VRAIARELKLPPSSVCKARGPKNDADKRGAGHSGQYPVCLASMAHQVIQKINLVGKQCSWPHAEHIVARKIVKELLTEPMELHTRQDERFVAVQRMKPSFTVP
jgi:hypothetical protein